MCEFNDRPSKVLSTQLPEAQALQAAIHSAVKIYYEYLCRHSLCGAPALQIICHMRGITETILKVLATERASTPVETREADLPMPPRSMPRYRDRRSRSPVDARHRLIVQHRLPALKVKR
jgi:hypothetical protein